MDPQELDRQIRSEYRALLKDCRNLSGEEELDKVKSAFKYINKLCEDFPFRWEIPVSLHSLKIARIVSGEMGLGTASVIAALLSEYYSAEKIDPHFLKENYGKKITEIIEGVHKISEIPSEKTFRHAENFRELILTTGRDVRVILIRIAQRLYLMRNLHQLAEKEQRECAAETRHIYSPLAHRLGFYNIMSEMEDISMKFLETEEYNSIDRKLKATKIKRNRFIKEFIRPLEDTLSRNKLKAEIKGRPKAISSIWRKMKRQNVEFEEVYDKFAIRVILNSKPSKEKSDCWRAYSLITDIYKPNPDRLRDWISVPKTNGYESLHTTVVVPGGEWVEVQIRTRRMDEIAERGLAAHWKYKGIKGQAAVDDWLGRIRELLDNPDTDALNLFDDLRLSLDNTEIFVFTPKGDLKKFPEGSTVLDFAFDIHTDVGSTCVGAKVNGKNVPIRYQMKNGDKIEIIRSKNQKTNVNWLNFVATSKAKSKIKQALKEEKLKEAENGREILKRRFKNWKLEYSDPQIRKLIHHYKYKDAIDLYYDIATEKVDLLQIKDLLTHKDEDEGHKPIPVAEEDLERLIKKKIEESSDYLIIDQKLSDVDYRLAKCCNPIFGDEIFGFVTISSGITIHRINCPNARQLMSKYGYRIVKAQWKESEKEHQFLANLRITGADDLGIVSNISEVISKDLKVNMRSFQMDSVDGLFEGTVGVFVKDTEHLKVLQRKLMKVKGVISVKRMN
ncbi:MAG: RelA/SpoT family protein [Bacteroidota bacterium]